MQPDNNAANNPNIQQPVVTVPPNPIPIKQPVIAPVLAPQQVAQAVVSQPQPLYNNQSSENFVGGYLNTLKILFTNPKSYFDNAPSNFIKSVMFPAINLAIMAVVLIITSLVTALRASSIMASSFGGATNVMNGEFFGTLFKNLGFSALYVVIFMFAIAGIIMIFALISKKDVNFGSIFSMSSIFSLNFLAVSVASIVGLLSVFIVNADFSSVIGLINNLIVSLVFVYAGALIIQGITTVTGFNLFKSTIIYVASAILMIFILGKIITTFGNDFSLSFGSYSNSALNTNSTASVVENSIKEAINKYLNY